MMFILNPTTRLSLEHAFASWPTSPASVPACLCVSNRPSSPVPTMALPRVQVNLLVLIPAFLVVVFILSIIGMVLS